MNNKGFQLSVNFLVVIILSLVLFGAGMFVFSKIISTSQNFKNDLDQRTIEQLDAVMDDGSLVVVPRNRLNGERGKAVLFPYGFWNEGDAPATFKVDVIDKSSNPLFNNNIKYVDTYQSVKVNERVHGLIAIKIPKDAASGQYAFDIKITKGQSNDPYGGSLQRVYVLVV